MIERRVERGEYLLFHNLSDAREVVHAVFTRRGGNSASPYAGLNLATSTGDAPEVVRRNREVVTAALGLPLVSAKPVHGANAARITRADVAAARADARARGAAWDDVLRERLRLIHADAMITDVPGFALFWAYADCTPVLLYDPERHVIALIHAGWRGTASTIVAQTVSLLRERYETRPQDLLVGIGPAIGACCYEIGDEVRRAFQREPLAAATVAFEERPRAGGAGTSTYLDVARSNERQLLAVGVTPEHIERSGYCTGCRTDLFYSHRREGEPSGRFGVALGLRGT